MVDELQLRAALSEQKKWGGKLGRTLVEMGFLDEQSIVLGLSTQLGLPPVDLDSASLPPNVGSHLRLDVAERYGVFPLGANAELKVLHLASSDPTNHDALQEIAFHTGMRLKISVATASGIDRAIRRYYYGEAPTSGPAAYAAQNLNEPTFEAGGPALQAVPSAAPAAAIASPEVLARLDELSQRMGAIEKLMANQVRAMRGMLELLVDKGVVSREEFVERMKRR